jgi:CheY-like chemotaxis protein
MSHTSSKNNRTSLFGTNPLPGTERSSIRATPTVLVADDNDDTRAMFRTLLAGKGYQVIEAADGEEAIELTSRENPGLVLLDLGLPRLNGLSVIRRLRNELKLLNMPVVVITGYDKHLETAVAAGCDDYLLKPVDFSRLDAILEYYVPTRAETSVA